MPRKGLPAREAVMAVLIEVAANHATIAYGELGRMLGLPTRGPHWKLLLDDIALNRPAETPDISVLVVNKTTGLPTQNNFVPVDPKSRAGLAGVRAAQEAVWAYYARR